MRLKVLLAGARTGAWNMARDRQLLAEQQPGGDPVLRLYRWQPGAVTIGYNQSLTDFNADRIAARGYDLVRRPTGGRAILHTDELTYALVGSASGLFGSSLHTTYDLIDQALLSFLERLGIVADVSEGEDRTAARGPVCFHSAGKYEIKVAGRKLIGSAQRRTRGVFLQHGSILSGDSHLELAELLTETTSIAGLRSATTDLGQLLGSPQSPADLDSHAIVLAACFAETFGLELIYGDE